MNIDQLKYLVDLAKTSSMNTTAKRMFISQQALSESMKRLEKELDCTLLTRSQTGVMFTDDGMAVLESAQNMLKHYQVMMDNLEARHEKEHVRGKISLGIAPVATGSFLPELLQPLAFLVYLLLDLLQLLFPPGKLPAAFGYQGFKLCGEIFTGLLFDHGVCGF